MRDANYRALLLDFDGTLVNFRVHPEKVRLANRAKRTLGQLAGHQDLFVAIVSGRRLPYLRNAIGVKGVRYFGLHGSERADAPVRLGKMGRHALSRAKRLARSEFAAFREIRFEDKRLTFAVHFRGAQPKTIRATHRVLLGILAPFRGVLRVLEGDKVWEVVPREIQGKGVAVSDLFKRLPAGTLAVYVGDDTTDEGAFAALPNQITVRVGNARSTAARFYLRNPGEVLRFLIRLERELS
jgi:trehalose 6-phosphate phosphatase